MDLLHVLAFLCMVGSCSAGECLAADEASSECLGLAFIQTYAKSSRAASPPIETKEHSSPPLDDTGHKTWRQGRHGREAEKLQDVEKSQLQDVEKRKQKPETKEDERSDEKDKKEKEETKAGEETEKKDEKTEENAEKTTEEKVEKPELQSEAKSEGKAEETEKEEPALKAEGKAEADSPDSTAEGPDSAVEGPLGEKAEGPDSAVEGPLGEKAEEKIEESAEAKSEEESAGATSEGTSENAAEGAAGAKREESYPAKAEHHSFEEQLHGWIDRHVAHGYGHDLAIDSLDRIKNKAEYFEAAREKYGEYQDHKQSGIVLGFIVGTPVWFTLFSLYVMCCSKRDRDADYAEFKGGMTEKLSDHTKRDDHLGLIGRIMEAGWFRLCILGAVLVDLFCLFIIGTVNQTDWLNPKYKVQGSNYAHGLRDVNIVILCVFLAEQFLHSITHGKLFFRHMWYMLDLVGSYIALVTGCFLLDLYPNNKFIPYLELLPLMRLWNVVAIILDLLLVTALAVEHEDEEIMQEEAVAEQIAQEITEGKEMAQVEAITGNL